MLGALVLVCLVVMSVVTLSVEDWSWSPVQWAGQQCEKSSKSCDILQSVFMPFLTLALATVAYLLFRFTLVSRAYLRKAVEAPQDLVETAGGIFGRVVGRDQLCEVLMEDLWDSRFRRAHVVIGGVGTGKTALLVLLTEQLASRGAVPVPLRLRGSASDLDFRQMAFERFCREVQGHIRSSGEAEKVWRRLCQQGRIVVLADGLEDALLGEELAQQRDTVIRLAIRRANDERLPLIVTSRPHDSLRGLDASLTALEPLSEEAALTYISSGTATEDRQRLDWIVEKAGIAEAPTYLQVAHDLHEHGLLERALTGHFGEEGVETRGADRAALRFHLLDTWLLALVTGRLMPEITLGQDERQATLDYLSALACVGLADDSSEAGFADAVHEQDPSWSRFPEIVRELARRVQGSRLDVRLAAHWGMRMGLVELVNGDQVRFQHSVVQAHLGARFLNAVIHPDIPGEPTPGWYFPAALENPGRELLIALVLHSRTLDGSCPHGEAHADSDAWCPVSAARDLLLRAACRAQARRDGRPDAPPGDPADPQQVFGRTLHTKAIQMYAAALEIDSVDAEPQQHRIAMELTTSWSDLRAHDPDTLVAAKTLLVSRFGEAMRTVAARKTMRPAYPELFEIARLEQSYRVRLAVAQEIGAGGDNAFEVLEPRLRGPELVQEPPMERESEWMVDLWESQQPEAVLEQESREHRRSESNVERFRRETRERQAQRRDTLRREAEEREEEERKWRDNTLCAWLVPLLVGSVTTRRHNNTPYEILESWVRRVGAPDANGASALDLSLEIALAQGFKYAANRRHRHPHARPQAREYLSEQAWDMLKRARFWFTRLTLLHALTLWDLPDHATTTPLPGEHGADPTQQVRQWLALPEATPQHPFVEAAAELCVQALRSRRPERFLWIDESGVAAVVGSQTAAGGGARKHQLWIPPSAGWSSLHPRAQQLLADTMLLLNLAERGEWPQDRARRLRHTARPDLPPCLTRDRRPLDPSRSALSTAASQAGSNCRDDCAFELCPYPPKGLDSQRVELSEAFCRAQLTLLSRSRSLLHPEAPWQRYTDLAELRRFWEQMGQRAQNGPRN
ncbi:ATP-binding protein [Streptomyces graminilatus]|uniref:ATP-binding protein n=1 Tax=Streptomyces graminilatus TaxID=1464070 RepID=UPI001F51E031|nr:ATP-binding protein [Streptomyces graminilatus]